MPPDLVTDPDILSRLDADEGDDLVTDPDILARLEQEDTSPVEQEVPRGTPRRSTAPQLAAALQQNNLFGSATTALEGASDKGIRRRGDGDWDLPLMDPQDPNAGVLKSLFQSGAGAINTGLQKVGRRLDDAGPLTDQKAIQKVFHDFQQANNLSDEEVSAAWDDLGIVNRTWGKDEKVRVMSDGAIVPNPADSDWLDPSKAEQFIASAPTSEETKAAFRRNLPQIQTNLAAQKLGDYEAASSAIELVSDANPAGALGAKALEGFEPPSMWAGRQNRTDIGTPQFMRDYEADIFGNASWLKEKLWGLAGRQVTGGAKVANTLFGIAGLMGSDSAAQLAVEGVEGVGSVNQGLPPTGLLGSIVEELPSVATQVVTGRVLGAFGQTAATAGTFGSAGLQSAGLTFADEIARGATEAEAREKATKAGVSTTLITAMFGTGATGGVERFAAGVADEVTVGQFLQAAREKGIAAATPELRKLAGSVLGSAVGEGAEEGIDQLVGAFLTADPDTPLADAWGQATQAATVGAVLGGGIDVATNMAQNAPAATAAAMDEPDDSQTEVPNAGGLPVDPEAGAGVLPNPPQPELTEPGAPIVEAPGNPEAVPLSSTGLGELGGAGRSIVDNFYAGIKESLAKTGEVPSAEAGTRVGKAWSMAKNVPGVTPESFIAAVQEASRNGDTPESWAASIGKLITPSFTSETEILDPAAPAERLPATDGIPVEETPAGEAGAAVENLPPEVESPPTDTTNETEIEGQRQGRQEVLTPGGDLTDTEVAPETPSQPSEMTLEQRAKLDRWEDLNYRKSQSKLPGKLKGKPLTKAEERELATLAPEVRLLIMEAVDPTNDSVVGVDINGSPIYASKAGTFYTFENGRPRTGPAFSPETPAPETPPAKEAAYSRDSLKETFNLDDDQATAADALVQALGLDTTKIRVKKGGAPGAGLDDTVTLSQQPKRKGVKGSYEVLADGDALIRGLTNPDISTALHELAHVSRRQLLSRDREIPGIEPEDIEVVELWAGAKDGVWSVAAEEKFARGFEQYLRDGKAPAPELATVFDRIGEWLKSIYRTVKGTPLDVKITPAMRRVLDGLVQRNAPTGLDSQPVSGKTGTTPGTPGNTRVPADQTAENQQSTSEPAPPANPGDIAPSELPAEGTPDSPVPPATSPLTSVKNAATDADLAAFGFDPIAAPAQKALQTSWDQALARFVAKPTVGADLTLELNTRPRATNDVEHGILLKELADRKLAYGQTQKAFDAAVKSGDEMTISEAQRENDLARDAVYNVITAAKATGTVWGRAGRFRQLAIDEDYSLIQMEAKYRTEVNMGKPLSKEQAAEIKALHDEIAKANKALEDYKIKAAEDLARAVLEATLEALRKARPKLRKALGSKISEAQKRLRDLGIISPDTDPEFFAQEDFPPKVIEDIATVAAGWMVDNALTPEQFEARLKKAFGDRVAGQAEAIRAKAREIIDTTINETFANDGSDDTTPRRKVPKTRDGIVENIDAAEGVTGNDVFQLARIHINEGVEGFENVMKAVLADLQQVFPELTLREVHDAYSGYGKTVFPSKEADLAKLREYRTLARLTSQLEDATAAQAPKRTGMQRDKPSEKIRTLQKQVRDMMRKMGINEVSDDKRLKSSLDSVKTRLRNEIEELEVAIRDRAPRPEGSKGVDYDAEANDLKAQRDALKAEYTEIFGKKELTDGDRIRMTVKALEKRIEETEKLIAAGKSKRDRDAKAKVSSPEIEALRAKLGGLNEQRNALRDREAERLERTKKLTENRIKEIRERIANSDYAPARKLPPVKPDAELGKLKNEEIAVKREFNEKLLDAQMARRSLGAKIYDGTIEVFNASRSIITSMDVSAVLRQGGFIAFGNPVRALRAIPAMFKAGVSENYAKALATEIEGNPYFVQSQKAKLFLSEFGDTHQFSKMEEAFRGRLAKKIPGVGKVVEFSERTYTAFLNKLRMDTFEAMAKSASPTGDLTEGEAKAIANFINVATGRGNLERYDKAAEVLAAAFFSPKYVVSRFQLLAMPMTGFRSGQGASARTRKAIGLEYAKTLAGISLVYALVSLMDDDDDEISVEKDPRSSDFGKIKIGNTRVDFMFGLLQATVLLSRLSTGEKKNVGGDIVALRGEDAGFGQSPAGVIGQFMRTKLAPVPSAVVNMIDGSDVVGNKVFWETELAGNLMPLSMGDIFSTMKEQGIPAGSALAVLALFGAGASTYGDDDIKPLEQDIMTKFFQVNPERYEE